MKKFPNHFIKKPDKLNIITVHSKKNSIFAGK
jgi:hypothetical protein